MVHQSGTALEVGQNLLYLEDTYLTEGPSQVAAVGHDEDHAWVALRQNVFHPQGGGQPADRGWLGEREVVPVRHTPTGLVVLQFRDGTDPDLSHGDVVHARVDAELRLLHAALHTAGHLVEAAGRAEGWRLAGNNHFPGQARIEFTPPQEAGTSPGEALDRLRAFVAAAIADDLPVTTVHDDAGRRVVRLGDVHAAPCGGTHVRGLADLAELTIPAVKLKKGRVRVSYTASHGVRR